MLRIKLCNILAKLALTIRLASAAVLVRPPATTCLRLISVLKFRIGVIGVRALTPSRIKLTPFCTLGPKK